MIISLICFGLAIASYTCSQLVTHNKFILSKKSHLGFFGLDSWRRKYKSRMGKDVPRGSFDFIDAPSTWYYNLFKIKYKEKFPLSATLLVWTTDFYHLSQFLFLLFISLSVVPLLGWTYGIAFWILAHVIHFTLYRTLQR